ncbi:hypothetical protein HYQ45_000120 [Verticillium longisporum]|uniref:Zn(2)-C6 fungal-type domain-containing protein n=1 Tax=Verticillium longisporum TaxID=100787 RepID=A0A8I3A4W9_VERLO|nr:hypothetical protein HYQ45_000120 [Verticillium longisporum]
MNTRGHQKRILPRTGYPRRRALAACLICRERKRKCDNLRPTCSSCQQIGAPCEYTKQDSSSFDAASLRILDQLSLIEGLRFPYIDFHGTEAYSYLDDLLTPSEDLSSRSSSGPPWKSFALISISTEKVNVEKLVEQFHQRVNIKNPILTAEKRLGAAISTVNTLSIQCLCLAGIFHMYSFQPMHALRVFHAAGISLQNLSSTGARPAGEASQMYSSLFWTCYKSEREILAEIPINAPALREPGMPNVYPQPPQAASIASNEWAADEEDSWYFLLSEIALRRITDQVTEMVSKYIHAEIDLSGSQSVQQLIPVVAEFEQQAESFRENLPPAVKFPDVPEAASTEWQQYSRGRYYRLLELMHRPFLFDALHDPGCSPVVRSLAEKGLQNALRFGMH